MDNLKGMLGLLKSERGVIPFKEEVCLKAKTYSVLLSSDEPSSGTKGKSKAEKHIVWHQRSHKPPSIMCEGKSHRIS